MLFFAAATQGFFLAGILGLHKRNVQANKILAVWIAVLSLDLLQQIYYAEMMYKQFPNLISLMNFLPLTYGGFLFLYVRSLITPARLSPKDILHFFFFFLGIVVFLPQLALPPEEKRQLIENAHLGIGINHWTRLFTLINPLVASVYAILSYRLLLKHPLAKSPQLGWLRIMLKFNLIIWLVVWLTVLAPPAAHQINNTIIYLLVSLVIYMLGYFSLRQPEFFVHGDLSILDQQSKEAVLKYGDNRLPDELRKLIWTALEAHMQEHAPWRSCNLTLNQLADNTGIASHHLSQVLNDHSGLSFSDYLNQYRISAICTELQTSKLNLLDIALNCGFSSKSSFNAILKKHTGKTPSEYRKQFQPS